MKLQAAETVEEREQLIIEQLEKIEAISKEQNDLKKEKLDELVEKLKDERLKRKESLYK